MLEFIQEYENMATLKVIGIGGGGSNAVNRMIQKSLRGVQMIVANTDAQALRGNQALQKIQIGSALTKGLGAGANPVIGRAAAEEDRDTLKRSLDGSDMVFITCGMGGGTGTGGAAVVADVIREIGALSVAVVTRPFNFEGRRRTRIADEGLEELTSKVDTLITIPNQKLLEICPPNTSVIDAFKMADDVLVQAVQGISDLIIYEGMINVDFADVRTIMSDAGGSAIMGTGIAAGEPGEGRAVAAANAVIDSPLLEGMKINGARGILINVTGGSDMGIHEVDEAASIIQDVADEEANFIYGQVVDESISGEIRITLIATGFDGENIRVTTPRPRIEQAPVVREPVIPVNEVELPFIEPEILTQEVNLDPPNFEFDFGEAVAENEFDIPTFIRMRSKGQEKQN